jgi:hypothetical protein
MVDLQVSFNESQLMAFYILRNLYVINCTRTSGQIKIFKYIYNLSHLYVRLGVTLKKTPLFVHINPVVFISWKMFIFDCCNNSLLKLVNLLGLFLEISV